MKSRRQSGKTESLNYAWTISRPDHDDLVPILVCAGRIYVSTMIGSPMLLTPPPLYSPAESRTNSLSVLSHRLLFSCHAFQNIPHNTSDYASSHNDLNWTLNEGDAQIAVATFFEPRRHLITLMSYRRCGVSYPFENTCIDSVMPA